MKQISHPEDVKGSVLMIVISSIIAFSIPKIGENVRTYVYVRAQYNGVDSHPILSDSNQTTRENENRHSPQRKVHKVSRSARTQY